MHLSWCYNNGVDRSFFLEWTNDVKVKIDERMSHLTNNLYTYKHRDCLSFPDVKNALDNIHKNCAVVPTDKVTGNITLSVKDFIPLLLLENCDWTISHLQTLTTMPVAYLQMI